MMKEMIEYDITSSNTLYIGHQEDNNDRSIKFVNYIMKNDNNTVYLKIEFAQPMMILLTDMSFTVKHPITLNKGVFNAQIVEFGVDDELVRNSNIFEVYISPSIKNAKEYELKDPVIDLEYARLRELYNTVVEKLENGDFIGATGPDAYEVAVENGFEGTREQWLESLKYVHSAEFESFKKSVNDDFEKSKELVSSFENKVSQANKAIDDKIDRINNMIGLYIDEEGYLNIEKEEEI